MMHLTLFIVYFLLLCVAVSRIRFFNTVIQPYWLVIVFGLHVLVGCLHNWIAFRFFPNHGDIWIYFNESVRMKKLLLAHPQQFLQSILGEGNGVNITDTSKPLLGFQYQALQCLHVLLNFLSFGNLYINTLLFSFPVFAGSMALFRFFYRYCGNPLTALTVLLLPSILFWISVAYKDAVFYLAMGYACYYFSQRGRFVYRWLLLLICIALMLAARANALLTLAPALLYLFLAEKKRLPGKWSLAITLAAVLVTAVAANAVVEGGLLHAVSERQKDFQLLQGGSRIYLPALSPNAGSFLAVLPVALLNGWLQPLPGTGGKAIYTAFSAELLLGWFIIAVACRMMWRRKNTGFSHFDIFCLLFALPGMIIIGYIVPFAGAIIRYRCIYLPFLLAPFINVYCRYPANRLYQANEWLKKHIMAA